MTIATPFHSGDWPDDWISPPGDTIADVLKKRGWSPRAFAENACIPLARAKRLIGGEAPIGEATAATLSQSLGSTSCLWIAREAHYRARIQQLREPRRVEAKGPRPALSKGPSLG